MKLWDELVRQGILGSQRQTVQLPEAPTSLADMLANDPATSDEVRFLNAAALIAQYRLNGSQQGLTRPNTEESLLPHCAEESLVACSSITAQHLRTLLANNDIDLLTELLTLMRNHQQRLPFDLLPQMLELGRQRKEVQALLAATMGERGRWLSRLNPNWQALSSHHDDVERSWREDSASIRRQTLQTLRESNPDQARLLLESSWKQESAKDRLSFLKLLRNRLMQTDAEFLRQCLDDRSQAIRWEATQQLVLLCDSNIIHQIEAICGSVLSVEKIGKTPRLCIILPETFDKSWNRLGLRETGSANTVADKRLGKKAGWISQWLQLLPPSRLAELFSLDFVALFNAIKATDFAEMLWDALDRAALHYADTHYIEQRLTHLGNKTFSEYFPRFATALSADRREYWLTEYLQQQGAKAFRYWAVAATLLGCCGSLSAELTRTFVNVQIPALVKRDPWGKQDGRQIARYLSVRGWPDLEPLLLKLQDNKAVAELIFVFRLRYQIHQEFV